MCIFDWIRHNATIEKEKEQQEQKKQKDAEEVKTKLISIIYPYVVQLAQILRRLPPLDTITDEDRREEFLSYHSFFKSFNLPIEANDWTKQQEIFHERLSVLSKESIEETIRIVFEEEKYNHYQTFVEQFSRDVNSYLLSIAPQKGFHVYGVLPKRPIPSEYESRNPRDYCIQPKDRFKHAYILGKTGAGKTTLLQNLITQDISRGDGVIVLSPEGALFDFIVKDFPASRLDKLILFDPTDIDPPIVSLNPLHLEDRRDLAREAGAVAGTLGRAMGDDLSGAIQTLLLKCAYTLLQLPNSSFQDLRALLKPVSPLRDSLPTSPHLEEVTREYWRDEFDKGGHRRSAEALISRLDAFFMPPLSQTLSRASFALSNALNASRSVFLFDFSRIHGTQQTIIGQLTLSLILQTLLKREAQSEADRLPYHLYIDEFQTFAENSETAFREMLNRARKYKMSVTLAHQVSSDIPPRLLDTILGNVGTKVCLQLATTDAEFFAKQLHVPELPESDNLCRKLDLEQYGLYDPPDPPEPAEALERLKVGEAFLSTPSEYYALRIDVPAEPLYYGGEPRDENYPYRVRLAAKRNYGQVETPTRADPPRPAPPSSPPPATDEDDGIFT